MASIPFMVAEDRLSSEILTKRLKRIHQGKVRDTYELPDHPDKLLVIATDRISIFDFVLGQTVPKKGEILTAIAVFWFTRLFHDVPNHLIAFGSAIDAYLPSELRSLSQLQRRAIVVKKLEMLPIECIARGYLTGTGYKAYKATGQVCGHVLSEGLFDGSKLPQPIFTPSTKANVGHDEHITAESVLRDYGTMPEDLTLLVFDRVSEFALKRGIAVADMKIEVSVNGIFADEPPSPDSCRFWDVEEYKLAAEKRKSPSGYDKEPVRQAGKIAEIDGNLVDLSTLDVTQENADLAGSWEIPDEVIGQTVHRYQTIFHRLTGMSLSKFQQDVMHIN